MERKSETTIEIIDTEVGLSQESVRTKELDRQLKKIANLAESLREKVNDFQNDSRFRSAGQKNIHGIVDIAKQLTDASRRYSQPAIDCVIEECERSIKNGFRSTLTGPFLKLADICKIKHLPEHPEQFTEQAEFTFTCIIYCLRCLENLFTIDENDGKGISQYTYWLGKLSNFNKRINLLQTNIEKYKEKKRSGFAEKYPIKYVQIRDNLDFARIDLQIIGQLKNTFANIKESNLENTQTFGVGYAFNNSLKDLTDYIEQIASFVNNPQQDNFSSEIWGRLISAVWDLDSLLPRGYSFKKLIASEICDKLGVSKFSINSLYDKSLKIDFCTSDNQQIQEMVNNSMILKTVTTNICFFLEVLKTNSWNKKLPQSELLLFKETDTELILILNYLNQIKLQIDELILTINQINNDREKSKSPSSFVLAPNLRKNKDVISQYQGVNNDLFLGIQEIRDQINKFFDDKKIEGLKINIFMIKIPFVRLDNLTDKKHLEHFLFPEVADIFSIPRSKVELYKGDRCLKDR